MNDAKSISDKELIRYVQVGNLKKIKEIIEKDSSKYAKDKDLFLLERALFFNQDKIVSYLLEKNFKLKLLTDDINDSIEKNIEDFLSTPDTNEALHNFIKATGLPKYLNKKYPYPHKNYATKHLGQLNSWKDNKKGFLSKLLPFYKNTNYEGSHYSIYIPQKITNLLKSLKKIRESLVNCQETFGENKEVIEKKIKAEIETQFTAIKIKAVSTILEKKYKSDIGREDLNNQVCQNICNKIMRLSEGEELVIPILAEGLKLNEEMKKQVSHEFYMGFKKDYDGGITRRIYNLGEGVTRYHEKVQDTSKFYPHVTRGISPINFEHGNGGEYLKKILGLEKEYTIHITKNREMHYEYVYKTTLGGITVIVNEILTPSLIYF